MKKFLIIGIIMLIFANCLCLAQSQNSIITIENILPQTEISYIIIKTSSLEEADGDIEFGYLRDKIYNITYYKLPFDVFKISEAKILNRVDTNTDALILEGICNEKNKIIPFKIVYQINDILSGFKRIYFLDQPIIYQKEVN